MRILITGGARFIGSHTAEALLKIGHEVRILDSLSPPVHERGVWPSHIPPGATRIVGDVTRREDVMEALQGCDAVIHLAAYQDHLTDFPRFFAVNSVGTALIYEVAVQQRIPLQRIIVASSQAVAGEGLYRCSKEQRIVMPGPRAVSQLEQARWELICEHFAVQLWSLYPPLSRCLHPIPATHCRSATKRISR